MTDRVERALTSALAHATRRAPPQLASALRYAVMPGGARIRPKLCLAVAAVSGDKQPALVDAAACAIELLHCASLVHDDLPCFDDAALRRGKPSLHEVFGEPLAVLTGDALIVLAFESVARAAGRAPRRAAQLMCLLASAAGSPNGLAAGQAMELDSGGAAQLTRYHRAKTGALFVAATTAGAVAAGRDPEPWVCLGETIGEAYQIADDLRDALASSEEVGKSTRRDALLGRPSAVDSFGVQGAAARLRALGAQACAQLAASAQGHDSESEALQKLVLTTLERMLPDQLKQSAA